MSYKSYFSVIVTASLLVLFITPVTKSFAEIKVFEKEIQEIVGKNQSQEQVEAFALQKAKRLAVEEAGTYISSLTIIKNYKLAKDEITALASGVVQAKIVGIPSISIKNGVMHVRVKSRIQVDTSILDRQIEAIMKEKGTLKKLEEERRKVKELENKLANIKRTELKRLDEINEQAIAIEIERDKQRVFREEQRLKARGDIAKAELNILRQEKERIKRFEKIRKEQENARIFELESIAKEKDRIKKAQLENERYWKELTRNAEISRNNWIQIDDSLSLKQAIEEASSLISEISGIKKRLEFQAKSSKKNLEEAYKKQIAATRALLPPDPEPKDAFETTANFNKRIAEYKRKVKKAEEDNKQKIKETEIEGELKAAQLEVTALEQRIEVLEPFIQRLEDLQSRKFLLPEMKISVILGNPDADNYRFPVVLKHKNDGWTKYWKYTDVNQARAFYKTRAHIIAQGMVQLESRDKEVSYSTTSAKVSHLGTKEDQIFELINPKIFQEISSWKKNKTTALADAKSNKDKAADNYNRFKKIKIIGRDGRFIAYEDHIVIDTRTGLMWASRDNGRGIEWSKAKRYCENSKRAGYTDWRLPTQDELEGLSDGVKKNRRGYFVTKLIEITECCLWASETRGSDAAYFRFYDGTRHLYDQSYSYNRRALPVRSGK